MTTVVNDYTALLSGNYWSGIETTGKPVIVTFSFPTSAPAYDSTVNGFTGATAGSFKTFSTAEQAQAIKALGEWASASGLIFVQAAAGQGDINFQNVDFGTTSYGNAGGVAFYPFGDWDYFTYPSYRGDLDASGDVFMNSKDEASDGTVNYGTLLHEIGHAIGLKHPTEVVTDYAANPVVTHDQVLSSDDPTRTIMVTVGDTATAADPHLFQLDKDAAAAIYGAAGTGGVYTTDASGNDGAVVWRWDSHNQVLTESAIAGADTIRGTSVTDIITANSDGDHLFGLAGNDMLNGGPGSDYLDGGPGADTMTGGYGDDTYYVDNVGDKVIEYANAGHDTVIASISYVLPANVEVLELFGQGLTGTGNALDNLIYGDPTYASVLGGGDGNDTLIGGAAGDYLTGGAGADSMAGGAGNDIYVVDNVGDVVTENANAGTDLVHASISYTLPDNVERLTLDGTANINGTGNALVNVITGNSGNNVLDGGAGADNLAGGAGDDTYYVDNVGDQVTEAANAGFDIIHSTVTYTLRPNVEELILDGTASIGAVGTAANDILVGNSAANYLNGMAGADTMMGGQGNDVYYVDNVGDVIVENANEGTDLVHSTVSYTLPDNVERLTLDGSANINATGNALANILTGNAGNNVLDGGAGADYLIGNGGTDTFYVDNLGDVVTETAGSYGTIHSTVSFTMPANISTLFLDGTADINGTGNADGNGIYGNSGNNVLDGGAGADNLHGGAGNDTYYVDNVNDYVDEAANAGYDVVHSTAAYFTLPRNVEELILDGIGNISGYGNSDANLLIGNSGNNSLTGAGGADTMMGGQGNDVYYVDNAGQQVIENPNEGTDLVVSSISYTLPANVERLTLANGYNANIDGTGNVLANIITGNSNDNVLTGAGGADTFVFTVSFAHDTITDFVAGSAAGHGTITFQHNAISGASPFTSYADVMAHAQQTGDDVTITDSSGDTLLLQHVALSALVSSDFQFI